MSHLPSINQVFFMNLKTEREAGVSNNVRVADHPIMSVGNSLHTVLPVRNMNLSSSVVEGSLLVGFSIS
jgi:hypothetical protein